MSRMVLRSRVGADGVLRMVVPFGDAEAERPMQVTIEPLTTESAPPRRLRPLARQYRRKMAG